MSHSNVISIPPPFSGSSLRRVRDKPSENQLDKMSRMIMKSFNINKNVVIFLSLDIVFFATHTIKPPSMQLNFQSE